MLSIGRDLVQQSLGIAVEGVGGHCADVSQVVERDHWVRQTAMVGQKYRIEGAILEKNRHPLEIGGFLGVFPILWPVQRSCGLPVAGCLLRSVSPLSYIGRKFEVVHLFIRWIPGSRRFRFTPPLILDLRSVCGIPGGEIPDSHIEQHCQRQPGFYLDVIQFPDSLRMDAQLVKALVILASYSFSHTFGSMSCRDRSS